MSLANDRAGYAATAKARGPDSYDKMWQFHEERSKCPSRTTASGPSGALGIVLDLKMSIRERPASRSDAMGLNISHTTQTGHYPILH